MTHLECSFLEVGDTYQPSSQEANKLWMNERGVLYELEKLSAWVKMGQVCTTMHCGTARDIIFSNWHLSLSSPMVHYKPKPNLIQLIAYPSLLRGTGSPILKRQHKIQVPHQLTTSINLWNDLFPCMMTFYQRLCMRRHVNMKYNGYNSNKETILYVMMHSLKLERDHLTKSLGSAAYRIHQTVE